MYKIIGSDRKEYGPYSPDQMRQWITSGRCNASTLVLVAGTSGWKPLGQLEEFKSVLMQLPPPIIPSQSARPAQTPPARKNNLLLILGIVGGVILVGIALVGILAAIAIPNFVRARQQAQTNICRVRLQLLATAVETYPTDHDGQLPPAGTWADAISVPAANFQCPADAAKSTCSFAFNKHLDGKKLSEVAPKTVLLFESDLGWNGSGDQADLVSRGHRPAGSSLSTSAKEKIYHAILVDGSFISLTESETASLRWEP
jgi:type II secretory pathway pseudopilin PulG